MNHRQGTPYLFLVSSRISTMGARLLAHHILDHYRCTQAGCMGKSSDLLKTAYKLAGRLWKIGGDAFISSTSCNTGWLCMSLTTDKDNVFTNFIINTYFIFQHLKLPQIIAWSAPSAVDRMWHIPEARRVMVCMSSSIGTNLICLLYSSTTPRVLADLSRWTESARMLSRMAPHLPQRYYRTERHRDEYGCLLQWLLPQQCNHKEKAMLHCQFDANEVVDT